MKIKKTFSHGNFRQTFQERHMKVNHGHLMSKNDPLTTP